jgi:hypothetical protein
MKLDRNISVGLDYCIGTPVADLAKREGIAVSRVYQILNKLAFRHCYSHSITIVSKDRMLRALRDEAERYLAHNQYVEPGTAQTPEEFYAEMLNEPRIHNF